MNTSYNKESELARLDEQIAFTGAYIFALSINIYAICAYKDIQIKQEKSKYTKNQIYKAGLLASSIALIVTIYFFIVTYEDYENNKVQGVFDFYTASTLSMVAQSIRFNAILKHPNDIIGIEDIV